MLRSVLTVLGSYVLSVVLVLCTDPILMAIFPGDYAKDRIPSNTPLVASTAMFVLISILCAWVCARFSRSHVARQVLWFFVLGELMGIGSIIPNWNKGLPHWYWLSWLATWPLSCWVGLRLSGKED